MDSVHDTWFEIMRRLKVDDGRAAPVFNLIVAMYSEPHRTYHTLQHIAHGCEEFAAVQHMLTDGENTLFSWLLHDVFYDPKQYKDNEQRSAHIALGLSQALGLSEEFGVVAVRKVLATAQHTVDGYIPQDMDTALLLDVDMSILGQSSAVFAAYDKAIAAEYAFRGPQQFRVGRQSFVKKVLQRDRLYHTDFFFDRYEVPARKNLQGLLE